MKINHINCCKPPLPVLSVAGLSPTEVTLLRSVVLRNSGALYLLFTLPTAVYVGFIPGFHPSFRLSVFKNC